ncbi:MAG: pimeloyl-ACP methyl ester carboxylesterase [Paracoccaceae bacterium]|jgi:pimeloyl-ACP methyl ester carboxylesterase
MTSIARPFCVEIDPSAIDDLKQRLTNSRLPEKQTVSDWSQGIPLDIVKEFSDYWRDDYDWFVCQERLNGYPQYLMELDGVDVHFLHIRSTEANARPLLMTHGWPGSVLEFIELVGPLTDPAKYGGDAQDAYHLVLPSIPGYGFSAKPTSADWTTEKIANVWDRLMVNLGYQRYFAQGGDWGGVITASIGAQDLGHCAGIHVNLVVVGAPDKAIMNTPTEQEAKALAQYQKYLQDGSAYAAIQGTRPQTIGYALADSPVGQMAWILEKFHQWSGPDALQNSFSKDHLLDNISLYWLSNSAASSARLYWHSFAKSDLSEVTVPMGASLFENEIIQPSRRWAEQRFKNIQFWQENEVGGHFAAMEVPELFVKQLRECLRSMPL